MTALPVETAGPPGRGDDVVGDEEFRATMASVPTPVSVVTVLDGERPHGTTVSAFASLSADPPMVTVALDRRSALLGLLAEDTVFGVNVLTHEQAATALVFAGKGLDKFSGVDWRPEGGAPRLAGQGGWLLCRATGLVTGGDHVIVVGTVLEAVPAAADPLTYHGRRFGTHLPLLS